MRTKGCVRRQFSPVLPLLVSRGHDVT